MRTCALTIARIQNRTCNNNAVLQKKAAIGGQSNVNNNTTLGSLWPTSVE